MNEISRRTLLKGTAAVPFGNARGQGFNNPVAVRFAAGNTIINKLGNFIYSGAPALGNLIASIAGSAGTNDSKGNPYAKGITAYIVDTDTYGISLNAANRLGQPGLSVQDVAHPPYDPAGMFAESGSNGSDPQAFAVLTSGKITSTDVDAALLLFSQTISGIVNGSAALPVGRLTIGHTNTLSVDDNAGTTAIAPATAPAMVAGSAVVHANSTAGDLQVLDGTDNATYATQRRSLILASNTATLAALTPVFTSPCGIRTYRIHAQLYLNIATTGAEFTCELAVPSGGSGLIGYTVSRGTVFVGAVSGNVNASVGLAVSLPAANGYIVQFDGTVNVTATGTINLQVGSLTATGLVVGSQSFIDVMPV